jgi:hypothetical protein
MNRTDAEKILKNMGWELFRGKWYEPCNPQTRRIVFGYYEFVSFNKSKIVDSNDDILLESKHNDVWYPMNKYDTDFINPKKLHLINEKDLKIFIDIRFKSNARSPLESLQRSACFNKEDNKQCRVTCRYLCKCIDEKYKNFKDYFYCCCSLFPEEKLIMTYEKVYLKSYLDENKTEKHYYDFDIETVYRHNICLNAFENGEKPYSGIKLQLSNKPHVCKSCKRIILCSW